MVNMLYNIIVLKYSMFFYMICDCITCDKYVTLCYIVWQLVTVICDIMLIPNSKSKNKEIDRNENRK